MPKTKAATEAKNKAYLDSDEYRDKIYKMVQENVTKAVKAGAIGEVRKALNSLAVTTMTERINHNGVKMTAYEVLVREIIDICSTPLPDEKLDLTRAKLALDALKMFIPPPAPEKAEDEKQTYTLVLNASDLKVQRTMDDMGKSGDKCAAENNTTEQEHRDTAAADNKAAAAKTV